MIQCKLIYTRIISHCYNKNDYILFIAVSQVAMPSFPRIAKEQNVAMLQELLQGSAILANADGASLQIDSWTSRSSETVETVGGKWLTLTFLGAKLMRGGWNKSIEDLHMLQGYERDGCESNLNVLSELWAGWEMIWPEVQMTVGNSAWQRCLQSGVKYHAHEKIQLHTTTNIITYYHILTCLHKHSRTL